LLKAVQVCVVGKVFKPNRMKVLALNRTLNEYDSRPHPQVSIEKRENILKISSIRAVMRVIFIESINNGNRDDQSNGGEGRY